jgi:hypothetical protein
MSSWAVHAFDERTIIRSDVLTQQPLLDAVCKPLRIKLPLQLAMAVAVELRHGRILTL